MGCVILRALDAPFNAHAVLACVALVTSVGFAPKVPEAMPTVSGVSVVRFFVVTLVRVKLDPAVSVQVRRRACRSCLRGAV